MSAYADRSRPTQFRLPQAIAQYVEERSAREGTTKTAVVVEAISCLREREMEALMSAGYREMSDQSARPAEEGLAAADETLPEW